MHSFGRKGVLFSLNDNNDSVTVNTALNLDKAQSFLRSTGLVRGQRELRHNERELEGLRKKKREGEV